MGSGQQIDEFLTAHEGELLEFVRELIGVDSQIPPYGDERAVVAFLQSRLSELGFPAGEIVAKDESRPNLLVRIPGSGGGPTLMLNGHIDTKPVGAARDQWHSDPLVATERDGKIFGLGTSDMKGAVAAMVYAAHAVRNTVGALAGDVLLAMVADEEAGATYGSKFLAPRLAGSVDACLIGEPSGWQRDWQGLHLVSRGFCGFQVRVHGTQMHSSLSDRMPSVNASLQMAELMLSLRDHLVLNYPDNQLGGATPTLNVGVLVDGGVFYGIVPGEAGFGCDIRALPGMTPATVDASLQSWLDTERKRIEGLDAEIVYDETLKWIPPSQLAADHPLSSAVAAAAGEVLGQAPEFSVFPGTTDAPWYDQAGIPTLPSFGPGILTYCHGPNEFVSVESIGQAARIYARTIAAYCGAG
jgi:acetylornithine deacetylase